MNTTISREATFSPLTEVACRLEGTWLVTLLDNVLARPATTFEQAYLKCEMLMVSSVSMDTYKYCYLEQQQDRDNDVVGNWAKFGKWLLRGGPT
jgi:hypothetical protein